jgi:Zn-dependent protease
LAIDDKHDSSVMAYPTFTELNNILSQHFQVLESELQYGVPSFLVQWIGTTNPSREEQEALFAELNESWDRLHMWAVVRWENKKMAQYVIRFIPVQKKAKSDYRINYALFLATLGTIGIAGFLQATSPVFLTLFYPGGWSVLDIVFVTLVFMGSLMGIIFCHEMGHFLTARRKGIDSSPPYFIPGLPPLGGTFGAFISQKSPPQNRRDLFDLGVSGPLAGFAVTLVVLIIGFWLSVPLTSAQVAALDIEFPDMTGSIPTPFIFTIMEFIFQARIPEGGTLYLHPVAFAGWVGCLVTALNLFPVSQLDGGHALRSLVGENRHRAIGYAATIVMFLLGYYLMAILVLLLSQGGVHPGPLNDTVPISGSRKAAFVLAMIILVLAIPPLGLSLF